MRARLVASAALLLCAAILYPGCGKPATAVHQPTAQRASRMNATTLPAEAAAVLGVPAEWDDQATPIHVYGKMLCAFADADHKRFAETVAGSPQHIEALLAMADMMCAQRHLVSAMEAAYGEESLDGIPGGLSRMGEQDLWDMKDSLEHVQVSIAGDSAVLQLSDEEGDTAEAFRLGGKWRLKAETLFGVDEMTPEDTAKFQALAAAFESTRQQVGKPGVTAEDISRYFGDSAGKNLAARSASSQPTTAAVEELPASEPAEKNQE